MTSRPLRQFSRVVLPQPLGPMIATTSPRLTMRSSPRSASILCLPASYLFQTPLASMMLSIKFFPSLRVFAGRDAALVHCFCTGRPHFVTPSLAPRRYPGAVSKLCHPQVRPEPIADSPHGFDARSKVAEFAAQPHHLRVHSPIQAVEVRSPQSLEQKLARERAPWVLEKQFEEVHLSPAEIERRACQRRTMADRVQDEGAERDGLGAVGGGGGAVEGDSSQQGGDPGCQLHD